MLMLLVPLLLLRTMMRRRRRKRKKRSLRWAIYQIHHSTIGKLLKTTNLASSIWNAVWLISCCLFVQKQQFDQSRLLRLLNTRPATHYDSENLPSKRHVFLNTGSPGKDAPHEKVVESAHEQQTIEGTVVRLPRGTLLTKEHVQKGYRFSENRK